METTVIRAHHFRKRAEEIRKAAEGVTDAECRRALIGLAHRYEKLSQRVTEISGHSYSLEQRAN